MTEEQFNILENYLENYKDELSKINTNAIKEDTDKIWEILNSQNKILENIVAILKDLKEN